MALRRAAFLREAVQAPFLEDLVPVVPHAEYLQKMRQGIGYLAGRRALEAHTGLKEPLAHERAVMEEGWASVIEWVVSAAEEGVVLLPGSRAPQLAVLPGYGLLEELALLAHAGIPGEEVLRMAARGAASFLGVDPPPGVLLVPGEPGPEELLTVRSTGGGGEHR